MSVLRSWHGGLACLVLPLVVCTSGGVEPVDEPDRGVVDSSWGDNTETTVDTGSDAPPPPFEVPPQVRWGVDKDPPEVDRRLAEECWVRPFLADDGLTGHRFPGPTSDWFTVDMAASQDRVYVVTEAARVGYGTWQYIHAVSADGEVLWSTLGFQSDPHVYLAVDPSGDLLAVEVFEPRGPYQGGTAITKHSPDGDRLWAQFVPPHPDDPSCCPTRGSRGALDDAGNVYLTVGVSVASVSSHGEPRWQHLLVPERHDGCGWDVGNPPVVVDDRVWYLGGCGVFAFSLDGDPVVWRPRLDNPELTSYLASTALNDGTVSGRRIGGGADVFDRHGAIVRTTPWRTQVASPDGVGYVVGHGVVAHHGDEELWRHHFNDGAPGPILDSEGNLVILRTGRLLDIFDGRDGARVAALDIGRRGFGPVGVSLRPGELVTQAWLDMPDGRRVAALQCLKAPVSRAHPASWSHREGSQRLTRFFATQGEATEPERDSVPPDGQ